MKGPKPFFVPQRPCIQCGVVHQRPFSYHKRTGWFLPGTCHKCHYRKYLVRDKAHRAEVRNKWMRCKRAAGEYVSGGRVGTFWAHPPARRLYDKLRRGGIGIEEARSEALAVFRQHQKERPAQRALKSA